MTRTFWLVLVIGLGIDLALVRAIQYGHAHLLQAEKATVEARMQAAVNASERKRLVTAEALVIDLQQQVAERDQQIQQLRTVQGFQVLLCQELTRGQQTPSDLAAAICPGEE